MSGYSIVVCGGLAPDPLQTLEPIPGPALKNELLLPSVLDPWASHALYEGAHLAKGVAGSRVWLVSLGPKAKLQQLMMSVAQKVPFELVALDGPGGGFTDSGAVAVALATAIEAIPGLDRARLILAGGWESATRGAGTTMQRVAGRLGITEQFQGVDQFSIEADGRFRILERVEGGRHQVSICDGPPVLLGWATGSLPEPPNNPQVGMLNMRGIMPALQKAKPAPVGAGSLRFDSVALPRQHRTTRVEKNLSPDEIAAEIAAWITGGPQ